jgi:hypothetical protein
VQAFMAAPPFIPSKRGRRHRSKPLPPSAEAQAPKRGPGRPRKTEQAEKKRAEEAAASAGAR